MIGLLNIKTVEFEREIRKHRRHRFKVAILKIFRRMKVQVVVLEIHATVVVNQSQLFFKVVF